jgi:hypothetical protein
MIFLHCQFLGTNLIFLFDKNKIKLGIPTRYVSSMHTLLALKAVILFSHAHSNANNMFES